MEEPQAYEPAPSSPLKRKRSETQLQAKSPKPSSGKKSSLANRMKRARNNITEVLFSSSSTSAHGTPKKKEENVHAQVFGRNLEEVMQEQSKKHPNETSIPIFVTQSVHFLMQKGLDVQGVFRQSASYDKVKEVKKLVDEGVDPFKETEIDPHTAACALKQFLRDLPVPLLTYPFYSKIATITELDDDSEIVELLDKELATLPQCNLLILDQLLGLLVAISTHSEQNSMTTGNIATVIGPALLWSEYKATDGAAKQLEAINVALKMTNVLVENYSKFNSLKDVREKEKQRLESIHSKSQELEEQQFLAKLPPKIIKAIREEQVKTLVSPSIKRSQGLELIQQSPTLLQHYEQENLPTSPRGAADTPGKERSRSLSRMRIKPKVFMDVRNLFDYQASPQKGNASHS